MGAQTLKGPTKEMATKSSSGHCEGFTGKRARGCGTQRGDLVKNRAQRGEGQGTRRSKAHSGRRLRSKKRENWLARQNDGGGFESEQPDTGGGARSPLPGDEEARDRNNKRGAVGCSWQNQTKPRGLKKDRLQVKTGTGRAACELTSNEKLQRLDRDENRQNWSSSQGDGSARKQIPSRLKKKSKEVDNVKRMPMKERQGDEHQAKMGKTGDLRARCYGQGTEGQRKGGRAIAGEPPEVQNI